MQPVIESMNTPGESFLRLPVESWPTRITAREFRPITFSGDTPRGVDEIVGVSIGTDAFYDRGWTPEKFAQFVASRSYLHVEIRKQRCPTLAVLAAYVRTSIIVEERVGARRRLSFITNLGEVTVAEYDGTQEGFEEIRGEFFRQDYKSALAFPGLTVARSVPADSYPVERLTALRQMQLREWKQAHARGKLGAPAGAQLLPTDLVLVDPEDLDAERPVIAHARTPKHLYEVIFPLTDDLAPLEVLCAVDGVVQHFVDPETGTDKGMGAHASEWAGWILRHSIPDGHRSEERPWVGNGPEARLFRLEHNIVNYEDHEADTSQFTTANELAAWLKKSLGNHNAPIAVHLLDELPFVVRSYSPLVVEDHDFHRSEGPEVTVTFKANVFQPWTGVANWEGSGHGGYTRNPSLQTAMDGQRLESFVAVNCLDYAALEGDLFSGDTRVNEASWFILWLEDTRTCITFPAVGSMLQVSTDHDGATAVITARERATRVEELDREYAFERQWARWLDLDEQLTKDEIQEGLRTLGQLIEKGSA